MERFACRLPSSFYVVLSFLLSLSATISTFVGLGRNRILDAGPFPGGDDMPVSPVRLFLSVDGPPFRGCFDSPFLSGLRIPCVGVTRTVYL